MSRTPPIPELPEVELVLRRSGRARRFSLRVSRVDGRVALTIPRGASEREALAFARSQTEWLRKTLGAIPPAQAVRFGQGIPFEGQMLTLEPARLRSPKIDGARLLVPEDPARLGVRVETFFKHAARMRLHAASARYASEIGRDFAKITIRDTRSRWGSCSSTGALSYSWRLIMAPPEVLDYVAAHEVAHLEEMNHSPAFWRVVEALRPSFKTERAWLKREGSALHAIRFRD
ncbi:zinc metalloprotease [Thioclava sediminum]|uniref:Zinc metalloprotease n=1 Tax=Thioclava sediminum TaxID=1915319 RepID=A0ABX3N0X4_9RHOB|nr:SprT family zinc-dependent metalloprotease [Thioclava sp. F36-7]OOY10565.1 zinc metalloprotease [Thioclava sp. F36-7]OOY25536.1 zinc metalloprotease [Thioclava sediminum]